MNRRARRQWRELRDRLFPERQIIFRSRGDVRYIALSTRGQMLMAASVVVFAGWIGYASVNVFYRDALLDSRDRRIAELSLAYDRLATDFERSQENFVVTSRDLEERYRRLYDMAMQQRTPGLPAAGSQGIGPQGSQVQGSAKIPTAPAAGQAQLPPSTTETRAAETKIAETKAGPKPAETAAGTASLSETVIAALGENLSGLARASADPVAEDAAAAMEDPASIEDLEGMLRESKTKPPLPSARPRDIENRIIAVRGRQRELLDELAQRTEKSVATLEKALRGTGLDITGMLARASEARAEIGVGGPLRELGLPAGGAADSVNVASVGDPIERDMLTLEGKLGRWGELMVLAQRLPLAVPMTGEAEVSSRYGRRVDPFTKQPAFHAGIDFIGPVRSPIMATAPGVVVFAGRKGPYGRTVEIDHGLGVKTRYAHMSSIAVQTGDTVPFGRQLGTMGSTGRSTGQHLHYEILLDDEQIDPSKFIEAGYHVFKQQEDQSASRR